MVLDCTHCQQLKMSSSFCIVHYACDCNINIVAKDWSEDDMSRNKVAIKKSKRRVEESFTEKSLTVSSDITSKADDTVSLETAVIINTESQDSCESLRFQLLQVQEETARLDEEVSILK